MELGFPPGLCVSKGLPSAPLFLRGVLELSCGALLPPHYTVSGHCLLQSMPNLEDRLSQRWCLLHAQPFTVGTFHIHCSPTHLTDGKNGSQTWGGGWTESTELDAHLRPPHPGHRAPVCWSSLAPQRNLNKESRAWHLTLRELYL